MIQLSPVTCPGHAEARKALPGTEREQEGSDPWKTQISEFLGRRKRNAIFNTDISTILARAARHNPCFPCKLVKREKPLERAWRSQRFSPGMGNDSRVRKKFHFFVLSYLEAD